MQSKGRVLITGASFGIGREIANVFARRGYDLILTARNREALADAKAAIEAETGRSVTTLAQDLAKPGAAAALAEQVKATGLAVSGLVNNAGFGLRGAVLELDFARQSEMIQLNVTSLVELSWLFGRQMKSGGFIMNVASTAAFQPGPYMAVYYATKAFVLSFSEALAFELEPKGIRVNALCPGPTESEFFKEAGMKGSKLVEMRKPATSLEVAEYAVKRLEGGARIAIPGLINRIMAFSVRFSPRSLVLRIAARMQK